MVLFFLRFIIYLVITDILLLNVISVWPGDVTPNDIEMAIGDSANITCHININMIKELQKRNCSSMYFLAEDSKQLVPDSEIAIIDKTTIVYMLRNASAQDSKYICGCGDNYIDTVRVKVGTQPLDVKDFKCRGHDYLYMECTFTKPHNAISTQYQLTYTALNRNYIQKCELVPGDGDTQTWNLTDSNDKVYFEYFNFTLVANNSLGTNEQHFCINHFESVVPPRPEFKVAEIYNNSVKLNWTMERLIDYKNSKKGLQYELRLRPDNFNESIININKFDNLQELDLNLPYAYYWYTAVLRLRVNSAQADETMWSEPYESRFQTRPYIPLAPPVTDVGSFYIGSAETSVRLYWQQLPVYLENGPNFSYVVERVKRDNVVISVLPLTNDSIYPTFPWEGGHTYEFTIRSQNAEGKSLKSSQLVVPPTTRLKQIKPTHLGNGYNADNRTYTISWSPPKEKEHLVDYTVFWCVPKIANSNECKGSIQFKHVKNTSNYLNIKSQAEQNLNFAISANYPNTTSGMVWITCSADEASDLIKMEPDVTTPEEGLIELQWTTDDVCSSLLTGYNLTYCAVDAVDGTKCAENAQPITITVAKTAKQYFLRNVEAFTTYKIQILMFSKLKIGPISDAQFVRTRESAPTSPRDLIYHNVTNNSACITWRTPSKFNGYIKSYTIVQNNKRHTIYCNASNICPKDKGREMQFKLDNLSSYTIYKVYVLANTVKSSPASNDIHFQTLIGRPSKPRHSIANSQNSNVMHWYPPDAPSGRVEFYEVLITARNPDGVVQRRISVVMGATHCTYKLPSCWNANYEQKLQVRAVNVAARDDEIDMHLLNSNLSSATDAQGDLNDADYRGNEDLRCVVATTLSENQQAAALAHYSNASRFVLYRSEWEDGPTYGCPNASVWQYLMLSVVSVGVLGLLLWVSRYSYLKYTKMMDIDCALPEGLTAGPYVERDEGGMDNFIITKVAQSNALIWQEQNQLLASTGGDYFSNRVPMRLNSSKMPGMFDTSSGFVDSPSAMRQNLDESVPDKPKMNAYLAMGASPDKKVALLNDMGETSVKGAELLPAFNGYVAPGLAKHIMMSERGDLNAGLLAANPKDSGYIKPLSPLMSWHTTPNTKPAISNSGYVTTNFPLKRFFNDYSRKSELKDSNKNLPTQCLNTSPTVSHTSLTSDSTGGCGADSSPLPISGYVTQKELSVFGHSRLV